MFLGDRFRFFRDDGATASSGQQATSRYLKTVKDPTRYLEDPDHKLRGLSKAAFLEAAKNIVDFDDSRFVVGLKVPNQPRLERIPFTELSEEAVYVGRNASAKSGLIAIFK